MSIEETEMIDLKSLLLKSLALPLLFFLRLPPDLMVVELFWEVVLLLLFTSLGSFFRSTLVSEGLLIIASLKYSFEELSRSCEISLSL